MYFPIAMDVVRTLAAATPGTRERPTCALASQQSSGRNLCPHLSTLSLTQLIKRGKKRKQREKTEKREKEKKRKREKEKQRTREQEKKRKKEKENKRTREQENKRVSIFVARLSQRECVGRVIMRACGKSESKETGVHECNDDKSTHGFTLPLSLSCLCAQADYDAHRC